MNRRMREPFHTLMWKASIGYNDSWSQVDPEVLEKFAELIIRECAELFKLVHTDEQYQRRIDKTIYKHFGLYE